MIWTFAENNSKNTDDVNLGQYKPTGKFYEDTEAVSKLMGIHLHPGLRPVLWEKEKPMEFHDEEDGKEPEEKPVTTVKFDKHRLDKNSMKVLFHVLPSSTVKTLKFMNNGITPSQFDSLVDYLNQTPVIQTVFFDWNPLYKEDYKKLEKDEDVLYHREGEEASKIARFVAPDSKVSHSSNPLTPIA